MSKERAGEHRANQNSHPLTQYVIMSHQERLIYFSLPEPALFFRGEENFNGHSLAPPLAHPDLPVSPFTNLFHHLDLLGDGPLHLETAGTRVSLVHMFTVTS